MHYRLMDTKTPFVELPLSETESRNRAILVAEDDVIIRFAISDCLTDRGFKVFEAGTAAEAIQLLESEPEIDVVFTDIRMPGDMDGLDVAKWVHENRPELAVLLTSGDVRPSDLAQGAGTNEAFIAKPYDLQIVATHISALTHIGR